MTNPNAEHRTGVARAGDPLDDPGFDVMEWIMSIEFMPEPLVVCRNDFVRWAESAGFENVEMRHQSERDTRELRCNRGTCAECRSPAQVERTLSFVARGAGYKLTQDQFIAIIDGGSVAARFKLEPRV